jgi:hypothetical protein
MGENDTTAMRTDVSGDATEEILTNLRRLVADVFSFWRRQFCEAIIE